MKVNQLVEKLLDKWPVKIICFVIAVFLYLAHQIYSVEKKTFVIPVTVIQNGSVMNIDQKRTNVNVTVKTSSQDINSIHNNSFRASVNIAGISDIPENGICSVPVLLDVDDSVLILDSLEIQIKPERIELQIEKKDLKPMRIQPLLSGDVEHGYIVDSVDIDPPFVDVLGPSSIIKNTQYIYSDSINIEGLKQTKKFNVYYTEINQLLTVENKGPYSITVNLSPEMIDKKYANVPVSIKGLSENFDTKKSFTSDIRLNGTVLFLENYKIPKSAISIDCSGINEVGTYTVNVMYDFPNNVKLVESSLDKVEIEIIKKENEVETTEIINKE